MDRVTLENVAFEGDNNVYVHDGIETVLVDTGVSTPENREQLQAGLSERGLAIADIDLVFVTHWHQDHAGMAGEIQRESGAPVFAHELDAELIRPDSLSVYREHMDKMAAWGMPANEREELVNFIEEHDHHTGESVDVEVLEDEESFSIGSLDLKAVHLPGHTAGLTGYEFQDGDSEGIITGDALLPVYTPNVGGADPRLDRPLERYLMSLRHLVASDFGTGYPGHRSPIDDVSGRAMEILTHHEERARRVLSVLERIGPADPWTVSAELFGSLEGIHVLHGPGEAFAHLDHLARDELLERTDSEYRIADPDWESETVGNRLPLVEG